MIKSTYGITKEPFCRTQHSLLSQQQDALDMIKIHAQHGGFNVIVGDPGVGKSVLRDGIELMGKERDTVVISFTQTLHTYVQIIRQIAQFIGIEANQRDIEKEIIKSAHDIARANRILYIVIDEAHLLDINVLRKLRLLFERFPKRYNLILFGQYDLLLRLSMLHNEDIKSRITTSHSSVEQLHQVNDAEILC